MVRYRCIGYGTTDGNGVATLNRNLSDQSISGYTGQGVGEVDFVASAESPSEINSSSDVSRTYPVLDTLFYDGMVTGNNNNTGWTKSNATFEVLSDGSGTEFIPTGNWGSVTIPNSDYSSNMPFVIEFEIVAVTGTIRLYVGANNNYIWFNATGKFRAEVTSTGITVTKDGASYQTVEAPTGTFNIGWSSNTTSNKGTIKDFKLYPI